ncbi:MAG: arsenite efflux transporter metallochaperone ArsD, partial [Gracilimonas sp.]
MSTKTATKTVLEVYDPAMCCSTGVCGPDVDDALADFANDVKWLKSQGVEVNRFNLGQEPEAFKMNQSVLSRLQKAGTECLPLILVNGEVVAEGGYPDREQLLNIMEIDMNETTSTEENDEMQTTQYIMTEQVEELVALGAALASNCESCLKFHYKKAKDLGLADEDI